MLRNGIKHGPHHIELFYGTPSTGNPLAAELSRANRFTVTRQLQYSRDETRRALDLALFINGLPVATAELKNSLTTQSAADAIEQYRISSTVGHAEHSGDLKRYLMDGKKIVISTVQKFPMILDDIGSEHRGRSFAIIIDEAHSSQGGRTSAALNRALAGDDGEDEGTVEDTINRIMEARRLLPNASYFAFTATPKNKTLEMFGEPYTEGGEMRHRPFHSYTMRQAIDEGFILDVLANYTPINSYYRLVKSVAEDPEYDTRRAQKRLRLFVEGNPRAIHRKAEIMVDHFLDQVIGQHCCPPTRPKWPNY